MDSLDLHPEELFDKVARGVASADELGRVDAHLASCATCRFERQVRADFAADGELEAVGLDDLVSRAMSGLAAPTRAAEASLNVVPRRRRFAPLLVASIALVGMGALAGVAQVTGVLPHLIERLSANPDRTPAPSESKPASSGRTRPASPSTGSESAPEVASLPSDTLPSQGLLADDSPPSLPTGEVSPTSTGNDASRVSPTSPGARSVKTLPSQTLVADDSPPLLPTARVSPTGSDAPPISLAARSRKTSPSQAVPIAPASPTSTGSDAPSLARSPKTSPSQAVSTAGVPPTSTGSDAPAPPSLKTSPPASSEGVGAPSGEAPETAEVPRPAVVVEPDALTLFSRAQRARVAGQTASAIADFRALVAKFPTAREAALAHAELGRLLLDRGEAASALESFDAYLSTRDTVLREDVLGARAMSLKTLGRVEAERAAWEEVLREYPSGVYAPRARTRLDSLAQ